MDTEKQAGLPTACHSGTDADAQAALDDILAMLHDRTGHDFAHYRRPILLRRLERRLQLSGAADLPAYLTLLSSDRDEPLALVNDLLIGVTNFFRDRAAFDVLRGQVLPALFHERRGDEAVRAWVAACSTGEEAYTLAMLLADHEGGAGGQHGIQLFASDLDEHAVRTARAGLYPEASAAHIPAPLLEKHFTHTADGYQVRKALRERILFARHDLLHDPVFSKLDLISCRNFLIYVNRDIHRRLLQQFHFALNPGGFLMLGSAESVEAAPDLFMPVDGAHRIFQARPAPRLPAAPSLTPGSARMRPAAGGHGAGAGRGRLYSFADIHHHKSAELGAPSILLDASANILHVSERAARFLHQAGGEPTYALASLVLPSLHIPLRAALFQACQSGQDAATGPVRYGQDGDASTVDMRVLPFEDPHAEGALLLVRFIEVHGAIAPDTLPAVAREDGMLRQFDAELHHLRGQLNDAVEQAEAAGNDMRVRCEEMQSTIEQLRATVADLEAGRDDLRSQHQALGTDCKALQLRVEEADKAHDDLSNLIASSGVATIFLDRAMRILRYTPRIADIFNVLPGDVGRPLLHITNRLDCPQLAEEAARVFDTLQAMEREVRATDGRAYIVRVHPYRTTQDRIEGAVMTFFDISNWRATEQALRASEERLRLFVSAVSDTLYKMSADWRIMHSLQGKTFLADTGNPSHNWLDRYIPEEDQDRVKAVIAEAIARKTVFELEHRVIRGNGEIAWTFSRAIPLLDEDGNIVEWFGAATDITARKRAAAAAAG